MKTDTKGNNFEPYTHPIRTSTLHSRTEDKKCIEGCMACQVKQLDGKMVDMFHTIEMTVSTLGGIPVTPKPANWRSMTNADYDQFLEWVDTNTLDRWQLGKERYQSDIKGFQGDPLDHAIEEMFDALLYLWIAKRRQDGALDT